MRLSTGEFAPEVSGRTAAVIRKGVDRPPDVSIRRLLVRLSVVVGLVVGAVFALIGYRLSMQSLVEVEVSRWVSAQLSAEGLVPSGSGAGDLMALREVIDASGGGVLEAGERSWHWGHGGGRAPQVWLEERDASSTSPLRRLEAELSLPPDVRQRLALRFGLAGTLIAWLSVWGGGFLAALVLQRLEESRSSLVRMATTDALTGIMNRTTFQHRVKEAIGRREGQGVLVIIDLDGFKEVNDTLGHAAGDALITDVARRLDGCGGPGDVVARLGGDEFGWWMPGVGLSEAAEAVGRASEVLRQPIAMGGMELKVLCSAGLCAYPSQATAFSELFVRADTAMYHAKGNGQLLAVYDPAIDPNSRERLALVTDLQTALERREIHAVCQPKIDLRTGELCGLEMLARWEHPRHGAIGPDVFIPLAEERGLIEVLTEQVVEESLELAGRLQAVGLSCPVAVNLSSRCLQRLDLAERLGRSLEARGLSPAHLDLELTESTAMREVERSRAIMSALVEAGHHLFIDDFGTGLSSLAYLRELPVQFVKIDKRFVVNLSTNRTDQQVVRAIINMSHALGKRVVAEGVEDEQALRLLRSMGCDQGQGYGIARPMTPEAFLRSAWLDTGQQQAVAL